MCEKTHFFALVIDTWKNHLEKLRCHQSFRNWKVQLKMYHKVRRITVLRRKDFRKVEIKILEW
jgi:hypothetical protein